MSNYKINEELECIQDCNIGRNGDRVFILSIQSGANFPYRIVNNNNPSKWDNYQEFQVKNLFKRVNLNKTEKAARFNSNKVEFHQIPLLGLIEIGKVATMGGTKYDAFNFKGKCKLSQYFDCKMRHTIKNWYGQDKDKELLVMHLAQSAWNDLAAIEHILTGQLIDDRYKGKEMENFDLDELMTLTKDQMKVIEKLKKDKEDKNG